MTILLAAVFFFVALGVTVYPVVSNSVNEKYASEIHTTYEEALEKVDDTAFNEAREMANAYNQAMVPGASDVSAYSQEALMAASTDYEEMLNITGDGTIGYVEIPTINVLLPIYHGTGNDSLERGIGHLLGSSLPVGGENTHAILSGHSGMASQKMFTDLEQLVLGDVFYLHVLNETLAYQINDITTVLPHDTSLLGIASGKDYCTLVTCTPYGINSHRLLVRGERIPYEKAAEIVSEIIPEDLPQSTWEEKYAMGIAIGLFSVLCLVLGGSMFLHFRRRYLIKRRNRRGGGRYVQKKKAKK